MPRAKQNPRADFTHNSNKLREIGYENSILVDKIAKISARGTQAKAQDPVMSEHLKVCRSMALSVPLAVARHVTATTTTTTMQVHVNELRTGMQIDRVINAHLGLC